jgi:hypothetical protein
MAEKAGTTASLDMREQFMATLAATLARLRDMYPGCPRAQRHVAEFLRHVDEARTRERSIKMWHRSMEAHYVAISQTRDAARREAALLAGMRANWFLAGLGMAEKWADPAFAPSRERFLQTVRVLNGLAFLQHSFLGKLAGALSQVTERLGRRAGGGEEGGGAAAAAAAAANPMGLLEDPALLDVMPQLLELIQPETLHEINRMLPHVTHILGGKDRLLAMLDQTLGEGGPMKGVLDQVLGALLGAEAGESGSSSAGGAGAAGGSGSGSGSAAPESPAPLSTSAFAGTLREIIERVSDPDNDSALTDTLAAMGLDLSAAMVGAGGGGEKGGAGAAAPLALSPDDIRAAFEGFREQFGEGALGDLLGTLGGGSGGGESFSMERLAAMAAGAMGEEGEGGAEGAETVARLTAAIAALQEGMAAAGDPKEAAAETATAGEGAGDLF